MVARGKDDAVSDRQERMLDLLARSDRPMTAAELSERLGVTPRSVRNYVSAINSDGRELVQSGSDGYRIDAAAYAGLRSEIAVASTAPGGRVARLLRMLTDRSDGIDVFQAAEDFHISESTLEGDLTKARARLDGTGLALRRTGAMVVLEGTETARRRLIGALFREESFRDILGIEAIQLAFPTARLGAFKTDLIERLEGAGATINEYGLSNVLLHISIAVDRVRRHHQLEAAGPAVPADDNAAMLAELVATHFDVRLDGEDLAYLSYLVRSRVATEAPRADSSAAGLLRPEDVAALRAIVVRAGGEFLVDLDDEEFLVRLALHVRNLVARAATSSYSRNPLTGSIKSGYPMTYELAVYIARELQETRGIRINDDEIAYIAMHVGALVEQRRKRDDDAVGATIVSPAYYDLHLAVLQRISAMFPTDLVVESLVTRTDVDWSRLDGDIVISTVEPPAATDRVVVVAPFVSDADAERIRSAITRIRRVRRRARLTQELTQYFDERLFFRNLGVRDPETMIRLLGERMAATGVIDQAYVDGAIDRERLSSTAFTEGLAVPHALAMTAARTTIAIVLDEQPMDWAGTGVNVVAFIAFSESDRARFQAVFDQFVEVFSERSAVQSLLRDAVDFPSFITALVHVMES